MATFFVNWTSLKALVFVEQRYLQGRNEFLTAGFAAPSRIALHGVNYMIQSHVIFVEALLEPLIQLLADAGVHARFLLGDQVAQTNPFIDILRIVKGNLTLLDRPPRLLHIVLQARIDLRPFIHIEDDPTRYRFLFLSQLFAGLCLSLAIARLVLKDNL